MPSGVNIRLYIVLALVFGVLAVGVFLYPGVPQTGLGWIVKALMLAGFGVYLWILLQDLQVTSIAVTEFSQSGSGASTESGSQLSQMEFDFQIIPDSKSSEDQVDATEAYNEFLGQLLHVISETMVSHAVMLYITDGATGQLVLQDSYLPNDETLKFKVRAGQTLLSKAFVTNEPVIISDVRQEEETLGYYEEPASGVQSYMAVPLRYRGQPIGVLAVDDTARGSYGAADQTLLNEYAQIISDAMVQLDSLDQLIEQKRLYARLCKVNSRLSLTDNQEELLQQIVQVNRELFEYESVTVVLLQAQNSSQAEVAAVDGTVEHPGKGYRFELRESRLAEVIHSGQPQLFTESAESESVMPELQSEWTEHQSTLLVPIQSHSETYGAIILQSKKPGAFSEQEQDILMMVGSVFGAGLNRFYLYRYMKNIATKDELTGVSNYRAFRERLEDEIQRSDRYDSPFTLFIADLDKFKRINDTHGHLYGDYMLKEVARIIKESVRNIDMVARYGGEEFAIILVNASAKNSEKTANRIREGIKQFQFEKNSIKERITISVGIAEYPSHAETAEGLIERADEAMYQVKQIGGNSVQTYQQKKSIEEA
ncbi:MAG: diguanylate cyclase [Candidatus Marinimicrobia bacterium]|nr:diguanylate cyclase [Candidatus Neomarinimicrobiota bacterium]MCF7829822.1 diguanylate cyclase [Candidatus Neomarinimicrobiota bacterium]MCF7881745.1 diguanylate cyclase [Candidatus Neomarinimicrobiota bacterium]